MIDESKPFHAWSLMAVATLLSVLVYWIGLSGPFLLDDASNLSAIPEWLAGKLQLSTILFERGAGTFGRPFSMASFAMNAWLGGYTPFALKLGNLVTHLACGWLIFILLRRLLRRDRVLNGHASEFAAVVAALWLLHPLHASTVLYVVQRMAQMSTVFILLGLWLYVSVRERLQEGPSMLAASGLLLGVPILTFAAFLSKENGAVLPLLCAVVELAYFGGSTRTKPVRVFYTTYLILPFIAGLIAFAFKPGRILDSYTWRDFTLVERLLSQGRALCDYLWKLVLPNPPRMGIYTDDFAISSGLLSPPSTLLALLVLAAISVAAWYWRKKLPAVFFGWFFFLAAHSLESGIIPLELYFEHRNYLPSVGILLALVALAASVGQKLALNGVRVANIKPVLLLGVIAVLAVGTHGRAQIWRSEALIAESSLLAHPQSLRANGTAFSAAIMRGDRNRANEILETLISSSQPRNRSLGHLYRLYAACALDHQGDPLDLDAFVNNAPMPVTLAEGRPFSYIYEATGHKGCGRVTDQMLADAAVRLADRAHAQPDHRMGKSLLRYQAANFYARAGNWQAVLPQAQMAWDAGADPPVAVPLVLAQLMARDFKGAEHTLREVESRSDKTNKQEQELARWLRSQIKEAHQAMDSETVQPAPKSAP